MSKSVRASISQGDAAVRRRSLAPSKLHDEPPPSTATAPTGRLMRSGGEQAERLLSAEERERYLGALKKIKTPKVVQGAVGAWSEKWESLMRGEKKEDLKKSWVINFDEPQETVQKQMKKGVRYVTSLAYGGHANQFISIGKLLYLAKLTHRVAIIPTLSPLHFEADPANISEFYDMARFWHESKIPFVEFSSLKPINQPTHHARPEASHASHPTKTQLETLPCWSVQEAVVGHANLYNSLDIHNMKIGYWPLPAKTMARAQPGNFDLAFDALRLFDADVGKKRQWLDMVKEEWLPQATVEGGDRMINRKDNLKEGFTLKGPEPDDQLLCFDNSLFMGPVMFGEAFPGEVPLEEDIPGEGYSWQEGTRYLFFNKKVEDTVDRYLTKMFGVDSPSKVPPFITVHLRRGDFKEFAGLTGLEVYQAAVERVREKLQKRLDAAPKTWRGPGLKNFRHWGLQATDYHVVTTTDEPTGSDFIKEVRSLGWKVLDHGEEGTVEKLGGWWPTILDAAVLARGQSFVGTDRSTFSHLAGLRVK
ncbi:GDP-fucose protein O-fucosyltransferase [Pseudohyphozyma bogoriensis]|nr:GDP-fucose protein O-fucosyltransferase [Pseudohyphozyma bogoriensis]